MTKGRIGALRVQGWRQCLGTYESHTRKTSYESDDGSQRVGIGREGARCRNYVAPASIERLGHPYCPKHEHQLQAKKALRATINKHMRAKYDPGPLYEE